MTKPKGPAAKYSQADVETALDAVKTKTLSLREAASQYRVPRSTLYDKLKGKYPISRVSRTVLKPEEENQLVEWIIQCSRLGEGKNREQVFCAVQAILNDETAPRPKIKFKNNKPGYDWYKAFLERHKHRIREKKAMTLGEQRAQVSESKIRAWFEKTKNELLKDGINIDTIPPTNVFNFDETGFPFHLGSTRIISELENKHPYRRGSDNKQQVTVLGCISAAGQILKPTIIFPGVRWSFKPWEDFKEADYAQTANGWINSDTFIKWLKYTFFPAVQHLERPIVLFLDGHTSHVNMGVYNFGKEKKIVVYVLPSHASHIIQPLDLVFFGSLKHEWKQAVNDYQSISKFAQVTKQTFTIVFAEAWRRAYSVEKCVNAFRASGLSPWNPEAPDYTKCTSSILYTKDLPPPVATLVESNSEENNLGLLEVMLPLDTPQLTGTSELSLIQSRDALSVSDTTVLNIMPCGDAPQIIDEETHLEQLNAKNVTTENGSFEAATDPSITDRSIVFDDHMCSIPVEEIIPSPSKLSNVDSMSNRDAPLNPNPHPDPEARSQPPVRDEINVAFHLSQLIDHVIACRWTPVDMFQIRRRQFANSNATESEPEYARYLELWKKIVPPATFSNLPIPISSNRKTNGATREQAPSYVSGESFREFFEKKRNEEDAKKKAQKDRRENMARIKEEKMKKKVIYCIFWHLVKKSLIFLI